MIRTVLASAFVLGLAAFAMEWLDYKAFTRQFAAEIYIVIIAAIFAALGVWVGIRLTPRKPSEPFAVNEAALASLGLTRRERSVLECLAAGQTYKEIARSLGVTPNTVKTHISNLFSKMGVERRGEAVNLARDLRILP
ncbi:response regulator transcription factor [Hyphobacterium marinum]|uniref:Helix-turn-helix transcriptional regulator n=1 Tax=Hyphobacterium marinum TaxID=3116574 RepID=A0ABU7LYE3_9PROT|nr:helix-turn-helix transcriptional regulator [Hyphobacterium sp. Y6023]MEE2566555.1 helix-turn-helix transcriptional regulator [Hyphobacterium sp. Y6023]